MNRFLVKLHFLGPLRAGPEGAAPRVHSDRLASALLDVLFFQGRGELAGALIEAWSAGRQALRLSSAFPFRGATLYFPSPASPPAADAPLPPRLARSLPLLPEPVFRAWVRGQALDRALRRAKAALRLDRVYRAQANTRFSLDRASAAALPVRGAEVHFAPDSGLWFLAELEPRVLSKRAFERALAVLGLEGLGAGRSSGGGAFRAELLEPPASLAALLDAEGDAWVTLSLFHPGEELPGDALRALGAVAWRLLDRRGRVASSTALGGPGDAAAWRRKDVSFFGEGSVFRQKPKGGLVDLTPPGFEPHKVWRSGVALACPILLDAAPVPADRAAPVEAPA